MDVIDHLLPPLEGYMHLDASTKHGAAYFIPDGEVTIEELITGALETAFWDMVISKHTEKMFSYSLILLFSMIPCWNCLYVLKVLSSLC